MSYFEELQESNPSLYQAILRNVASPEQLHHLQSIDSISASASYQCMTAPKRVLGRGQCAVLFHTKHSPPLALEVNIQKKERPSHSKDYRTLRENFDISLVINNLDTNESLARYHLDPEMYNRIAPSPSSLLYKGGARYHWDPNNIASRLASLAEDPQYSELDPMRAEWHTVNNDEDGKCEFPKAHLGRLPGGVGFAHVLSELPLEQDLHTLVNSGDFKRLLQGEEPSGFEAVDEDVHAYSAGFRGASRHL